MLQIIFAILAGILTISSPCIIPILPIILGASLNQNNKTRPLFIVIGFILAFSFAAGVLSILTRDLGLNPNVLRDIGTVVLGLFGLLLIWPLPFELLAVKITPLTAKISTRAGLGNTGKLSALILGLTLGIVWTPCAGPVLGSILTLIALQKSLSVAFILLVGYAMGASVPMLVIAYGGQYISERVGVIAKYSGVLQKTFGVIIILLAMAIYFNYDTKLYSIILQNYPSFNPKF